MIEWIHHRPRRACNEPEIGVAERLKALAGSPCSWTGSHKAANLDATAGILIGLPPSPTMLPTDPEDLRLGIWRRRNSERTVEFDLPVVRVGR
jgi:hypothetical protein